MAVGTALTIASAAATAAGAGMSFAQANKQKKLYEQAQSDAAKSMVEAKKAINVNYYEGLSIPTQAYKMESDILKAASAQAIEAGREGDQRGVAATAGRVQAATNEGARAIRSDMAGELYDLNKLTQTENKQIASNLAELSLAEAQGAQLAARDAKEARAAAISQGFQGVASLGGQLAAAAPLYEKTQATKALTGLENDYNAAIKSGKTLNPALYDANGNPLPFHQAIQKMSGMGQGLNQMEFQDYMLKQDVNNLNTLRKVGFYPNQLQMNPNQPISYQQQLKMNTQDVTNEPWALPTNAVTSPSYSNPSQAVMDYENSQNYSSYPF